MYIRKQGRDYIAEFDSPVEFATLAKSVATKDAVNSSGAGYDFLDHKPAAENIITGTVPDDMMRRAREIVDAVDTSFRDREVNQWMPSVAGAYPVVPEYLIGMPESMRARVPVESDQAPLDIYIEANIAAGVTARELTARGTAIAAFIMRVSEGRPVSLNFLSHNKLGTGTAKGRHVFMRCKLDTHPVSLAQVLSMFAVAKSCRAVRFAAIQGVLLDQGMRCEPNNDSFEPAWRGLLDNKTARANKIRELWGIPDNAIVVQRGNYEDADLMEYDPVEWVHRQLEKQRTILD